MDKMLEDIVIYLDMHPGALSICHCQPQQVTQTLCEHKYDSSHCFQTLYRLPVCSQVQINVPKACDFFWSFYLLLKHPSSYAECIDQPSQRRMGQVNSSLLMEEINQKGDILPWCGLLIKFPPKSIWRSGIQPELGILNLKINSLVLNLGLKTLCSGFKREHII